MNDTPTRRKNALARYAPWALAVIVLGLLAAFVVRNIVDFIPVAKCRHAEEVIGYHWMFDCCNARHAVSLGKDR